MSITDYDDIRVNDLADAEFYETANGFLGLKKEGNDLGRVNALRMFPLTKKDTYISIIDKDKKEVGIIYDMSKMPEATKRYIQNDLDKRYFMPEILKFIDIKEEFNYTFFKTETTAGYREITAFDMNVSLFSLGDGNVLLNDVDGNKYLIRDLENKGKKALKYLEIWL